MAISEWGQRSDALSSTLSQSQTHQTDHAGFPRLRNALLQQPYRPYTTSTHLERAALSDTVSSASKSEDEKSTCKSTDKVDASLLNLSVEVDHEKADVSSASLVKHQCPYCSYATFYPEVLWIHQRIAHKVDSTTLVPKWAPRNGIKGPKTLLEMKRRTGPPPFLEGKDCPSLPQMRTCRTSPPDSSPGGTKKSKCPSAVESGSRNKSWPVAAPPGAPSHSSKHKTGKSGTDELSGGKLKADVRQNGSSRPTPQKTGNQKPGSRGIESSLLPQEGLHFMLSSKHNLSDQRSSKANAPGRSDSQEYESWSRLGLSGPSSHAQSRKQSAADSPEAATDIMSFLKTYSPHDLAALYHHWGFSNAMAEQAGSV